MELTTTTSLLPLAAVQVPSTHTECLYAAFNISSVSELREPVLDSSQSKFLGYNSRGSFKSSAPMNSVFSLISSRTCLCSSTMTRSKDIVERKYDSERDLRMPRIKQFPLSLGSRNSVTLFSFRNKGRRYRCSKRIFITVHTPNPTELIPNHTFTQASSSILPPIPSTSVTDTHRMTVVLTSVQRTPIPASFSDFYPVAPATDFSTCVSSQFSVRVSFYHPKTRLQTCFSSHYAGKCVLETTQLALSLLNVHFHLDKPAPFSRLTDGHRVHAVFRTLYSSLCHYTRGNTAISASNLRFSLESPRNNDWDGHSISRFQVIFGLHN